MTTQRQIDANRRNAEKSTGPKTEEGKSISRGNATKHGLSGQGFVVNSLEAERLAERLQAWRPSFREPLSNGPSQERHYEQMVLNSLRIERAQTRERQIHEDERQRAIDCWDEDRQLKAETIGGTLLRSKTPSLVVAKLRTFLHGLEWLIARWTLLKDSLESGNPFSDSQMLLLQSLLGIPEAFREGSSISKFDPSEIILDQLEKLQGACLESARRNDFNRRMLAVETGYLTDTSREERLNRRYEDLAHRRYERARKQLLAPQPEVVAEVPQVAPQVQAPAPPMTNEEEIDMVDIDAMSGEEFSRWYESRFPENAAEARARIEADGGLGKLEEEKDPSAPQKVSLPKRLVESSR